VLEAKRSMVVGASFGLLVSIFLAVSGDESAYQAAQHQPAKLAAMEGLYKGEERAGIIAVGILNQEKKIGDDQPAVYGDIEIPYALSFLGYHDIDAFVPGLDDLVLGNEKYGIEGAASKIEKGKIAIKALKDYKEAKRADDQTAMAETRKLLDAYMPYFGYGYLEKPTDIVPPIATTFYSFHIMVGLGIWFIILFLIVLYLTMANDITRFRKVLWLALWSIPLGYIAAEAGWVVAEVGRQPWAIQDLMPVGIAATDIDAGNVKVSFWLFALLFTVLLIAEIKIMLRQIAIGIKGGH
ncbi:MAG: cytochrome ubiquinol oxidase subunit I, partial [Sulfurovum sp.]